MKTSAPLIVVTLALLGAGCGSSGPGRTTGQSASSDPAATAYRYADCMRSHGVTSFPDPHVRINGNEVQVVQGLPPSAAASPRFNSAQRACRGIIPAPGNGPQADQPGHKAALLAFAQCMRAHGVSDFPDPNVQGQITRTMLNTAGLDFHSHLLLHAALGCVAVTHGVITAGQVRSAVNGPH